MLAFTDSLLVGIQVRCTDAIAHETEIHLGISTIGVKRSVERDVVAEPGVDSPNRGLKRRFRFYFLL